MSGVSGSSAVIMSVTASELFKFDRDQFPRHPRRRPGWSPRSAATASPCQHARSTAIACCGADLSPFICESTPTHGVITWDNSLPVTTAMTPEFLAAPASIAMILACA